MELNKSFFDKLSGLEHRSMENMVEATIEGKIEPDYQYPFYMFVSNEELYDAIEKAAKGKEKPKYLDPCCQDAFSLILANKAGCEVYGGDIEEEFIRIGEENIEDAITEGLIKDTNQIRIVVNDMFDIGNYEKNLGVAFEDVDILYIFSLPSQIEDYVRLFSEHAKKSARLIFLGSGLKGNGMEQFISNTSEGCVRLLDSKLSDLTDDGGRKPYTYQIYEKI